MKNKESNNSRRTFLKKTALTTSALAVGASALSVESLNAKEKKKSDKKKGEPEWRNKRDDMVYRRLGRTNFMVSEIVFGGIPVEEGRADLVRFAIDSGINYIDTASGYTKGHSEKEIGKAFKEDSSLREKVFLATKVSPFSYTRNRMYREVFKELTPSKQEEIQEKANALMKEREVAKPGYFYTYFAGQIRQYNGTYLSLAMQDEYAHKVDETGKLKQLFIDTVEESLTRMNTDYIDVIQAPHGAGAPEDLHILEMHEAFEELKKQGKVRFLGVSTHNDPSGVVDEAVKTDKFAMALVAYNFLNAGYLDASIKNAYNNDMGIIAMKSAAAVTTHHEKLQPLPTWRAEKIHKIIRNDMSAPLKAYLWSLQNPYLSAVVSHMINNERITENLALVGQKVEMFEA